VTDADARAWAELLGDENPLHTDAASASASGMGAGLVNPGPAGLGYLITMLLEALPGASMRSIRCKFVAPVMTPVEVVATGCVQRRERRADGEILHATLELHAAGTLAVAAEATVQLPAVSR
jgi:acyl dehydratase